MKMLEEQLCQECNSTLVDDMQSGETICTGCGVVVRSHMIDYGPESASSDQEEKIRLARATGLNTYSQHDLGVTTAIDPSTKDFSGKVIDRRIANQMNNLRNWQKRIRISSPQERRLAAALTIMGTAAEYLGLPKTVLETASILYRNIDSQMNIKGRSVEGIAAAILYMACKQCGVVRSIDEIAHGASPSKSPKTKLASRYYRNMVMEVGQANKPAVTTDKYISKFANMAQVDTKVERMALRLAEATKKATMTDGKSPHGIAAAYLYIASTLLGHGMPQREISTVAEVTEVTIRNRCKEIMTNYKITISLQPALAAATRPRSSSHATAYAGGV